MLLSFSVPEENPYARLWGRDMWGGGAGLLPSPSRPAPPPPRRPRETLLGLPVTATVGRNLQSLSPPCVSPNSGWGKKRELRIGKPKTRFGRRGIRVQESSVFTLNVRPCKVAFPSYDPSSWFPYAVGVAPCPARR